MLYYVCYATHAGRCALPSVLVAGSLGWSLGPSFGFDEKVGREHPCHPRTHSDEKTPQHDQIESGNWEVGIVHTYPGVFCDS